MSDRRREPQRTEDPVLSVRDLVVEFATSDGVLRAVDGVSFDLYPGETLGVVGESGSGKTVSALSILGLLPRPAGSIAGGEIIFEGRDLTRLSKAEMRKIRGGQIGMVFQDPMTSLNPVLRVGFQIAETIKVHMPNLGADRVRMQGIDLLSSVRVSNPEQRYEEFPHQYSGGMRQRAMIAIATANQPKVLIADEPTTALDVTIQAQVLESLQNARAKTNASMIIITHDLGIIAEMADRVIVMYGGRIVETGDVRSIFASSSHPYTLGLLESLPRLEVDVDRLTPISGQPPSLVNLPSGCPFHPRCQLSAGREVCRTVRPDLIDSASGSMSACHFQEEMPEEPRRMAALRHSPDREAT
ncbi:MAG: ABC transporter ATP-binding protein [Acidimicrobiia bacterium]|nr:ABC transporter ATP-binding protein [Acidimicrobiia bacterium]